MVHDWLDTALHYAESGQTGFIDAERLERLERRFRRQYPEHDAGQLQWASLAVAAWFLSQPIKHKETIAPEILDALRGAVDRLNFGSDAAFLSTLWAKAHAELNLTPALGKSGIIGVDGDGLGFDVMAGLYEYAASHGRILLCEHCARPFTARVGARTCSAGCRSAIAKSAA